MKKILATCYLLLATSVALGATEMTIWYSPTCPHCHDAREFARDVLVPEFGENLTIIETNASAPENGEQFMRTVRDCKMEGGFVPLIVVGEKCFQGFSDSIGNEIKSALSATGQEPETINQEPVADSTNTITNTTTNTNWALWGLLAALAIALGFVLLARKRK
ncbi:MAG: LPXTG cell wall anchor domain-containing protein [Rickettsiales bacterium]|nr:LPXTG cell wall anchor domain-containing protein [Rickettsiales bacterium]